MINCHDPEFNPVIFLLVVVLTGIGVCTTSTVLLGALEKLADLA